MAKSKAARKRRNVRKKQAAARDAQACRTGAPKPRNPYALEAIIANRKRGGYHGTPKGKRGYKRPQGRVSPTSYSEVG